VSFQIYGKKGAPVAKVAPFDVILIFLDAIAGRAGEHSFAGVAGVGRVFRKTQMVVL
jgi:hypothetical protein